MSYKELEGVPHVEAICIYNREMPASVNQCSWFKEIYKLLDIVWGKMMTTLNTAQIAGGNCPMI